MTVDGVIDRDNRDPRALLLVRGETLPIETDDASDVDDVRTEHLESLVTPTGAGASQWY